jgi:hypothetical protein
MGVIEFIKKYYVVVAFLGAIILILNQTGFNLNIPTYYSSLETESKILFIFLTNSLLTILGIILVLSRIKSSSFEKPSSSKRKKKK